ncbi:LysR family transcriptional regulator [Bordetella bronchiseptica]|uniref:LysR-family transcriptional regulator n=3 Tax=Bordetella bronchiseptica TaxID=518 RepID=A0A0H3LIX2_BORBR|nr:LysR family transcriptional regulator [Bordetella bronchiseptica]KAK66409.1 LysR substrate-binding domain protein [Bordetella bronchiseptica 980-2]SHR16933.1 LysR family transcriptional regulator [Mycobacteroides abscessus subsp. abscessus]AMG87583.1 LysR family transcriptional regulator [Bordetella bronchiseptica]AWP78776.1 LysR family transcriptional regulator [Bordetella bronchiseptica]AZW11493.1 LysR family transcriptional regulator [Bordetella bronchiseptica]
MRIEDLAIFTAVHDYGSFQKAADVHGLTQSAVTKIVRRLETHYGMALVERGARTTLTQAGRALYDRAVELLKIANTIERDLLSEDAASLGTLRMGAVPALLELLVLPAAALLLRRYAHASLTTRVKLTSELVDLVIDGRLDLAVGFEASSLPEDIVAASLGRQHYKLVVRAGGPLAGRRLSLQALADCEWLLPSRDIALRRQLDRHFEDAGLNPPRVRLETDTSAMLFAPLIRETDLIAIMAEQSYLQAASRDIAALDTALPPIHGDVMLYYRRQTPSTPMFAEALGLLRANAAACFGHAGLAPGA